jgi:Predicted membrane protein (DUF2207)
VLFLLGAWPFLIPIVVAFYMFWLAWTRGGDPEQDSATVQYEPPENFTPAECGALLDNGVSPRVITATIVDLSVKGYFAIEPNDSSKAPRTTGNQDYTFHLIKQPNEWNALKPHEHAVIGAIFLPTNAMRLLADAMSRLQKKVAVSSTRGVSVAGVEVLSRANVQALLDADTRALAPFAEMNDDARPVVTLSESQNYFYLHKTMLGEYIFDELIAAGYYSGRPDRLRQLYVGVGILIGIVLAAIGRFLPTPGTPWYAWTLSGILTALIIAGFGSFLPARSLAGARALGKVRGFAEFLGRVEKDHIERMEKSPELFEKYLPYAMALGVENKWAQAFGRITVQPKWHRGPGSDFFPTQLVARLSAMPNQTGHAMAPTEGAA